MIEIFADEQIAFDMYFASIVAMQFHPGAGSRDHVKLTIEECKDQALEMVLVRRNVLRT